MLDINLIRKNLRSITEKLSNRGIVLDLDYVNKLELERKRLQVKAQKLQEDRNKFSKKPPTSSSQYGHCIRIPQELKRVESKLEKVLKSLNIVYSALPNLPHESVPIGKSQEDNVVVRTWGEIPKFDFKPKDHTELSFHGIDFEAASKLSGSRFVVLTKAMARLHRALGQFMLDFHVNHHGYDEFSIPYLVSSECLYGTGQLPKMEEDIFRIADSHLCLIPTSEVALANLVRNQIFNESDLPLKLTALSPCFRKEAGSYGKETKGMIRQHQFDKVELVQIVKPEASYMVLEEMVAQAEAILQALNLPYRVVKLCTYDLGFSAAKTYDIEVWLPSQNRYCEISSCSNTEAFQARRMQARFRDKISKGTEYVHTLNASGLAVGRTMVALMENHQDKRGAISIPEVLEPYIRCKRRILGE